MKQWISLWVMPMDMTDNFDDVLEEMNKIVTYENIQRHLDDGLIRMQEHPQYPNLKILNYTQECQFKKKWTPLTKMCRGLVVDFDGMNVVARPFEKFFNLSEHTPSEIPVGLDYTVYEKMDGSLGILFNYKGEWIWCTRGSFTSDQCVWARTILKQIIHMMYFVWTVLICLKLSSLLIEL